MTTKLVTLATIFRGYIAIIARHCGVGIVLLAMCGSALSANSGVVVTPSIGTIDEEIFQTLIIMHGLKDLGFDVQDTRASGSYAQAHAAVAQGRATFMANHWQPLHNQFFAQAGGKESLSRRGVLIDNIIQGYLIDEKTATQYKITHLDQLKDPRLSALFDIDGDDKADLTGCETGWGCAAVIDHQLTTFGLRSTVTHHQQDYANAIRDKVDRVHRGQSALFYTWTPYWVTDSLAPGPRHVVWLQVRSSSLPAPRQQVDTTMADGRNLGFAKNTQHVLANRDFVEANPIAGAFFSLAKVPVKDVSEQNLRMHLGENSRPDIERHAREWIAENRETYDSWLAQARQSAKPRK